jgi:hypothetical protein
MDEVMTGYIAGFFDGEGCISLTRHVKNGCPCIKVLLTNNDLKVLRLIQRVLKKEKIEVSIFKRNHRYKNELRPHFVLAPNNYPNAIQFLRLILPYLSIKKEKAELALLFLKTRLTRLHKHWPKEDKEALRLWVCRKEKEG